MEIDKKAHMIDQVVSMDLPVRRVVRQLYDAAFEAVGKPLCLAAAEKLAQSTDEGDSILILTGFTIPPANVPETDGPPGAAVLAHTLQTLGTKPVLITDNLSHKAVKVAAPKTQVIDVPIETRKARQQAEQIISRYNPSALVAIERPGWNGKQEYHNMRGLNISNIVGKTDHLFEMARRNRTLTIGVADGGNELGCGLITQTVRKHVPYGVTCQCPCRGGIAAATPSDVLVIAGISNWGAYGIAACVSLLKGLEYKHNKQHELRLLGRTVKAGAIDSISQEHKPYVDGLSPSLNGSVVDLIHTITNS